MVKRRDPPARLAIVTNIVAPYRTPTLRELARLVSLRVFYSAESESRRRWMVSRALPFEHEVIGGPAVTVRGRALHINPRLFLRLLAFRPTIVGVGGFSAPALYAMAYCAITGASLVIISEGTGQTEARVGFVGRLLRRVLVRTARCCIASSGAAAERFRELGAPAARCVVAPYALDLAQRPMRRHRADEGRPQILFVGQFTNRKGLMPLLDAAVDLASTHAFVLTLVGHGELESALPAAIFDRGLEACVRVRGFVDQDELASVYAEHDLFVFPTLEDTFGVVLLEAMAAGLPVIASNRAGATDDFVDPGETGWIVDPLCHGELAAVIERAFAAREAWPVMGAAARARIAKVSPEHVARAIWESVRATGVQS
jgi:glycosyltransferase involved in cell wall biosynthesis